MTQLATTSAQLKADLEETFRAGHDARVLEILAQNGDTLDPAARAFHSARVLLKTGQPQPALAALDAAAGTSGTLWHRKLRLRALLALGQFDAAAKQIDRGNLPESFVQSFCARAAGIALDCGDFRQAEAWGLRYRRAVPGPDARFSHDLAALVMLEDTAGLRDRLALCGADRARALGMAIRHVAIMLCDNGTSENSVDDKIAPCLALAPDLVSMWALFNGLNLGEKAAPPDVYSLVWRRITGFLSSAPILYDDVPKPRGATSEPAPEIDRVADWLCVPLEARGDWHARHAAAQAMVTELSAATLGSAAHRDDLAHRLPTVDWSGVRDAMASGAPVIVTGCHASCAAIMPLEFQRSGIDMRIVSPPRFFANVPEFVAMHCADLEGRNALRTARRMVELLRDGACIFATADGQMGARVREFPEFGLRARLPTGLWPLARRYGARVFWMQTGWHAGHLQTRLHEMNPPDQELNNGELDMLWHREVLRQLYDSWHEDLRNIHQNRVVLQVTRPGSAVFDGGSTRMS